MSNAPGLIAPGLLHGTKRAALGDASQWAKPPVEAHCKVIAQLAYQLWKERGRPAGCEQQLWLEAEDRINKVSH